MIFQQMVVPRRVSMTAARPFSDYLHHDSQGSYYFGHRIRDVLPHATFPYAN